MIEWSSDEREQIWTKAIEWWENEVRAFALEHDFTIDYIEHNFRMFGSFMQKLLPAIDLSNDDEWNRVVSILSATRDNGVYLTEAASLRAHPSKCGKGNGFANDLGRCG